MSTPPYTTREAVGLLTPAERESIGRAWISAPEREWFHLPTREGTLPAALRDLTDPDHGPLAWRAEPSPHASGAHGQDGDRPARDYVDALGWLLAVAEEQATRLYSSPDVPTLAGWAIATARLRARMVDGGAPREAREAAWRWARARAAHYAGERWSDGLTDAEADALRVAEDEAADEAAEHSPGHGYGAWEHGYAQACDGCGQPAHHEAGWWLPDVSEWESDDTPVVCRGCGRPDVWSA